MNTDEWSARMLQNKVWNYYQIENASCFDKSHPRLIFLAKQCINAEKVLNIGVGSGYLEERLIQMGTDVYSLDPSDQTIELIRKKLSLGDKARIGYSDKIPFESNLFDVVIMTEVLEHLDSDALTSTLQEVYRVLNQRGMLIGTVPYKENLDESTIFCPHCGSVFHRWGHVQTFDQDGVKTLMQDAGFRRISLSIRAFPDWNRRTVKSLLKSLMRYILGRLGAEIINPNIYFKAYKY